MFEYMSTGKIDSNGDVDSKFKGARCCLRRFGF